MGRCGSRKALAVARLRVVVKNRGVVAASLSWCDMKKCLSENLMVLFVSKNGRPGGVVSASR